MNNENSAQNVHQAQEAENTQRLHTLSATIQKGLDESNSPAIILTGIVEQLFGKGSDQARALSEILEADKGSYEVAMADLEENRTQLWRRKQQLADQLMAVDASLDALEKEQRELYIESNSATDFSRGIAAALKFIKSHQYGFDDIYEVWNIWARGGRSHVLSGLLYGYIIDLERKGFARRQDAIGAAALEKLKSNLEYVTKTAGHNVLAMR